MSLTSRFDAYQRRHTAVGLPLAVFYKFFDDQGGYLTALMTYYGFLSLFPLLLVAVTVLGFVISNHPQVQVDLIGSALAQFPIVGKQIQTNVHGYAGSGAGLVIGLLGALYGSLGIAQASQNAMNTVWAVPRNARPNPLKSRLRSLAIVMSLGFGVLITTGVSALASGYGIRFGVAGRVLAILFACTANVGLFLAAFRFLTVKALSARDVLAGAVVAGVVWQVLQSVGSYYVNHKLKGASEVYGVFGVVLGLIAWIYLEALIVVLCAELNVVRHDHLWPRSLLTPFTDDVELTRADADAYDSYARAQQHKGFETIEVDFDDNHLEDEPGPESARDESPGQDRAGVGPDPVGPERVISEAGPAPSDRG
jgi:membrane protein